MAKLMPVQRITHYNLELTEEELKVLFKALGLIAGCEQKTYRKYTEHIYNTIRDKTGWYLSDISDMFAGTLQAVKIEEEF